MIFYFRSRLEHAKRNIEIECPNIHKMKMSLFDCVLMMCLLSYFAAVFATWIFSLEPWICGSSHELCIYNILWQLN